MDNDAVYGSEAMLLLIGLYGHPEILSHTVSNCAELQLFDPLTEPGYEIIWKAMANGQKRYGQRPTPFMVNNDIALYFKDVSEQLQVRALKQIQLILPQIVDNPPRESRERVRDRLEKVLQKAVKLKVVEDSSTSMDITQQAAKLAGMADVLRNVAPQASVRKRPLAADIRPTILRTSPRYPWGIPYWDASGNTWYKKELHGLLGPTGGGKTVNACNIAEAQLRAGFRVAVALYEQALEEDVAQRLYANLATIPMDFLRGKDYEDIDPDVKGKLDRVASQYVDQLLVLDMVGENAGNGGPQELFQHLQEERRETGFWPDIVIVDWLGEMALRYEKRIGTQDGSMRHTMESFMSDFNQFKETPGNETTFLILHQTSTNAQAAGPGYRPKRTDAHEFRSFANKCDTCCQLGTMDNDNMCWFIPGKIRRGQRHERIIKLDGRYMRFDDVSMQYQESPTGGGFMSRSAADEYVRSREAQQEDYTSDVQ